MFLKMSPTVAWCKNYILNQVECGLPQDWVDCGTHTTSHSPLWRVQNSRARAVLSFLIRVTISHWIEYWKLFYLILYPAYINITLTNASCHKSVNTNAMILCYCSLGGTCCASGSWRRVWSADFDGKFGYILFSTVVTMYFDIGIYNVIGS